MGEVVNVIVAFAVIVFLFRWVTSSSETTADQRNRAALGFRPKNATQDMINTVANMFPDIPTPNIHYDLLRTGSVELTTNKILERGFLDAPPPIYHTLYPQSSSNASGSAAANNANRPNTGAGDSKSIPKPPSLIQRYRLETRVDQGDVVPESDVGGKAVWEDSAEKREASLRERKAQMILAARQRLLAQQQNVSQTTGKS